MSIRIPFIQRLHWFEYLSLLGSLILILLETLIRIITLALPRPVIHLLYRTSRRVFNFLSSASSKQSRNEKRAIVQSLTHAHGFVELCEVYGYAAEEHIVQTKDGYFLGLHRLAWKKREHGTKVNAGPDSIQKKVVFCMHGLLMNSEVWVCLTERERCLPFQLVEQGYDVWFGNNRGNKYSKKSTCHLPAETGFWSFSIDEFAFHDIPDSITYILETTGQSVLSYVGFSQGTAQAFASLSINPILNDKVDVFVALAPAMAPPGLSSPLVNSLVKASPNFLFLAFGRKAILSSTLIWEALLYPPIFVRLIDMSISFLFGWHGTNISDHQKLAAYPHLFSFTSTKSVVHWFQIIRNGKFQMYDDGIQSPFLLTDSPKYYKVAKFPTRNIRTPIVLLYGGSDSLVDIDVMLKELPSHAKVMQIPHYEHLDFLWAQDVDTQVFPHIFQALRHHTTKKAANLAYNGNSHLLHLLAQPLADAEEHLMSSRQHSGEPTLMGEVTQAEHIVLASISPFAATHNGTNISTEPTTSSLSEECWSLNDETGTAPSTPRKKILSVKHAANSPDSLSLDKGNSGLSKKASHSSLKKSAFQDMGIQVGPSKAIGTVNIDIAATGDTISTIREAKDNKRKTKETEIQRIKKPKPKTKPMKNKRLVKMEETELTI